MIEELYTTLYDKIDKDAYHELEQVFKDYGFREKENPDNILIIDINQIGDAIISSGCIREIRKRYPEAYITLIHSIANKEIYEYCPYVNNMISYNYRDTEDLTLFELCHYILDFCKSNLWDRKYDMSFYFRRAYPNFSHACLSFFSGAQTRIGYFTENSPNCSPEIMNNLRKIFSIFMPNAINPPPEMSRVVLKNFHLLQHNGFTIDNWALELWYTKQCLNTAQEAIKTIPKDAKKCLICVGGSLASKRYPVEQYAIAFKTLLEKYKKLYVIICGGNDVIEDSVKLTNLLESKRVLNVCGKLAILETAALTSLIDLYVGNDTCAMHMAAVHKKPVLELSRGAKEIDIMIPEVSEVMLYPPYNTPSVILRPYHRFEDCNAALYWGGCKYIDKPHCITQIEPEKIVKCIEKMRIL